MKLEKSNDFLYKLENESTKLSDNDNNLDNKENFHWKECNDEYNLFSV